MQIDAHSASKGVKNWLPSGSTLLTGLLSAYEYAGSECPSFAISATNSGPPRVLGPSAKFTSSTLCGDETTDNMGSGWRYHLEPTAVPRPRLGFPQRDSRLRRARA